MTATSASLLDQLRSPDDDRAWPRFVALYTPYIRSWLRRHGLADQDCDDLVQNVLAVVFRRLPDFRRGERLGSFRRWLRTITVNCLRDHWRAGRRRPLATGDSEFLHTLDQLEDPESHLSRQWDEEHQRHVTSGLLEMIRPRFSPRTWQAFSRVVLDGAKPEDVARELGTSVNSIFIAKSRVLSRLRQEGEGLLDG